MFTVAVLFLGFLWISRSSGQLQCQPDVYKPIPDIQRRGVNIPVVPGDPICDNDLENTWYRIDEDLVVGKVDRNLCGTFGPVYLIDDLPTNEGETLELTACRNQGFGDPCDAEFPVNVTNCGSFNVYYLIPVECPHAYCINANTTGEANVTVTFADETTASGGTTVTDAVTTATDAVTTATDAVTTATDAVTTATDAVTTASDAVTTATETASVAMSSTMMTSSCSASQSIPYVRGFGDGPFCSGGVDCSNPLVLLLETSPVENSLNLMCRFREVLVDDVGPLQTGVVMTAPAEHVDCNSVRCPIPAAMTDRPGGPYVTGWFVAVSNDNISFGNERLYLPFNRQCTWCEFSPEDIPTCSINNTHCYIDGNCWLDGDVDPDNSCGFCNISVSTSEWSPADSNVCMVNGTCYADGAMDNSTRCKVCHTDSSVTSFSATDGFCLINDECFADGERDPVDGCNRCNSEESKDSFVAASDVCNIGGNCVQPNTPDPSDPCKACDPERDTMAFSDRLFSRRNGNSITCAELCWYLTYTDTAFDSLCKLTESLARRHLEGICTLQNTSDLDEAPCVSQGAAITRYQNICIHYPGDVDAALRAACG